MPKARQNRKGKGNGTSRARNPAAQSARDAARRETASLMASGRAKLDLGDHDGAIADYERAIEIDREIALARSNRGNIAEAYAVRGNVKTNNGDHSGAREDYECAVDLFQNSGLSGSNTVLEATDLLEQAAALLEVGDHDGAIVYLDRAIAHNPNYAPAYLGRGDCKDAKGDYHGAIADYDRAIALYPSFDDAYYNRGTAKKDKGDYDGAISDFDRTIALNPNSVDAYNNRGEAKNAKGDHDGAIADFDHAIKLAPHLAEPHYNRGLAEYYLGNYDRAIADFDRSTALNPDDAVDYYFRGLAKDLQGGFAYDEVIADFNRAIAINPDFTDARYNRGVIKWNGGDLDGAIADFDHSHHPDPKPDYALRYYNIAAFSAIVGNISRNYEEAIAELKASAPDISKDALDEFASMMTGNYDSIIADFDRAVELNSDFALAYLGRGNVNAMVKDFHRAIADFDRAIELNHQDAKAYFNRGAVKAEQEDYDGAIADFDQAVALDVDSLLGPEERRLFYDVKERAARAVERERSQSEHNQLLEIADQDIAEYRLSYANVADERDWLSDENYQLRAQIELLTKALVDKEQTAVNAPLSLDVVQAHYYEDSRKRAPFKSWLAELDPSAQKHVNDAIARMRQGNFSASKSLHAPGLFERRLDSGLRIYYARESPTSVLILGGGDKPDQQGDIDTAAERLADWRARHPQ